MVSENDHVFRNLIESDSKNEERKKNLDGQENHPVFYTDKNVAARDLREIVVNSNNELTYNILKDICVDEGVHMKDYVRVNLNPLEESKLEDSTREFVDAQDSNKLNQENLNLIVIGEVKDGYEVGCEKSPPREVVTQSGSVSMEALTLADIISMEDSQKHPNNKKQELNYVLEDSFDHNLFPNCFGERSFCEAESGLALITYSGPISVIGSLSVRSDGSTVSESSFAFPILQSEWNSSPIRMVKAEKKQVRKEKGWRQYSLLLCCRF